MNPSLPDQNVLSLDKTIEAFVQDLHTAIQNKDTHRLGQLVLPDVFVFGPAAAAVSVGREQFVAHLRSHFERVRDAHLRLRSEDIQAGLCDSGHSAWILDRFILDIVKGQEVLCSYPVRLTALLVRGQDWRLAAAYWSIPLRDNEYQYSLIVDGKIQAGAALEDRVTPQAQPLAESILKAMAEPPLLPQLYSTRADAFTIGSTVDEVFFGADGKNFVAEIAGLPIKFAVRGGIQAAVAPDGCMAWLATHIDLTGRVSMPYRFLFVWLRELDSWKIVISHDAVSIDPADPGFEVP
jgi:ketosteroid isomerase-like protein